MQSDGMETNQAAENLQVIRTLMERSALYRRALAPVMLVAGLVGIIAAVGGAWLKMQAGIGFVGYWVGVACLGLSGALLLVRRQALKSQEVFWSPPTKRVAQAMAPPFAGGFVFAILWFVASSKSSSVAMPPEAVIAAGHAPILIAIWTIFYGCALHAAGFFTPRGLRWFGWLFVLFGFAVLTWDLFFPHGRVHHREITWQTCHWLMGFLFGFLQLAYGIYLYFTERKNAA